MPRGMALAWCQCWAVGGLLLLLSGKGDATGYIQNTRAYCRGPAWEADQMAIDHGWLQGGWLGCTPHRDIKWPAGRQECEERCNAGPACSAYDMNDDSPCCLHHCCGGPCKGVDHSSGSCWVKPGSENLSGIVCPEDLDLEADYTAAIATPFALVLHIGLFILCIHYSCCHHRSSRPPLAGGCCPPRCAGTGGAGCCTGGCCCEKRQSPVPASYWEGRSCGQTVYNCILVWSYALGFLGYCMRLSCHRSGRQADMSTMVCDGIKPEEITGLLGGCLIVLFCEIHAASLPPEHYKRLMFFVVNTVTLVVALFCLVILIPVKHREGGRYEIPPEILRLPIIITMIIFAVIFFFCIPCGLNAMYIFHPRWKKYPLFDGNATVSTTDRRYGNATVSTNKVVEPDGRAADGGILNTVGA